MRLKRVQHTFQLILLPNPILLEDLLFGSEMKQLCWCYGNLLIPLVFTQNTRYQLIPQMLNKVKHMLPKMENLQVTKNNPKDKSSTRI